MEKTLFIDSHHEGLYSASTKRLHPPEAVSPCHLEAVAEKS
jgi:hypothetical protein